MLATTLVRKLEELIAKHGNCYVEIDANGYLGITEINKLRYVSSDSERGDTFIIEGGA